MWRSEDNFLELVLSHLVEAGSLPINVVYFRLALPMSFWSALPPSLLLEECWCCKSAICSFVLFLFFFKRIWVPGIELRLSGLGSYLAGRVSYICYLKITTGNFIFGHILDFGFLA